MVRLILNNLPILYFAPDEGLCVSADSHRAFFTGQIGGSHESAGNSGSDQSSGTPPWMQAVSSYVWSILLECGACVEYNLYQSILLNARVEQCSTPNQCINHQYTLFPSDMVTSRWAFLPSSLPKNLLLIALQSLYEKLVLLGHLLYVTFASSSPGLQFLIWLVTPRYKFTFSILLAESFVHFMLLVSFCNDGELWKQLSSHRLFLCYPMVF